MYVDHLMASPPGSPEDVWNATREHSQLFTDAAHRIGLSDAEYQSFRNALLDGKALYVKLPRRMDAMSGARGGSVYAVKNAVMTTSVMGWKVTLAGGTDIYVPQVCGNLSVLRHPRIAHAQDHRVTPSVAQVPLPPEIPVALTPPQAEAIAIPAAAPEAMVPASNGFKGLPFIIPAAVGGIWAGLSHGGSPAPPCSGGSNVAGVCSK